MSISVGSQLARPSIRWRAEVIVPVVAGVLILAAPALADEVRGTSGDDHLTGSPRADDIRAYAGDDVITARGGLDSVQAGRGVDELHGGRGGDVLLDGPGRDRVYGEGDRDAVNLGGGADRVWAGASRDYVVMRKDGRADVVRCGPGRDLAQYLRGRDAGDRFIGCETVERYSP